MTNTMTAYRLREILAYSRAGKLLATWARNALYPHARVHWVQQAFADGSMHALRRRPFKA